MLIKDASKNCLEAELRQLEKAMADPIYWFENCVYTQDQHCPELPARPFPKYKEAEYLYKYIELLLQELQVIMVKSRQIMFSWVNTCFLLWLVQFRRNQFGFFISEKQRKANNLIQRAKFTYNHQPFSRRAMEHIHTVRREKRDIGTKSLIPFYPPRDEYRQGFTDVQSKLEAFSEEADDIRMETASVVFVDEAAYVTTLARVLQAVTPALGTRGRLIIGSSVNGKEEFYRLVNDLDEDEVV